MAQADLYATKVRPVLVIQSDLHDAYDSIVTCLITTHDNPNAVARVKLEPGPENGLAQTSFAMTDKIFSFDKADLARRIGALSGPDMDRVSEKLRAMLGL